MEVRFCSWWGSFLLVTFLPARPHTHFPSLDDICELEGPDFAPQVVAFAAFPLSIDPLSATDVCFLFDTIFSYFFPFSVVSLRSCYPLG